MSNRPFRLPNTAPLSAQDDPPDPPHQPGNQLTDALAVALWRVLNLAEKWENATELSTGQPSLVARAFAAELRNAINGTEQ